MEFNHIHKRKHPNNKRIILLFAILIVVVGLLYFMDELMALVFN